jgi:predicted RNA-binding Zn-ribbon protein involved in translation (DUF1610 family)
MKNPKDDVRNMLICDWRRGCDVRVVDVSCPACGWRERGPMTAQQAERRQVCPGCGKQTERK